jgi:ATP-dependent DNA helicase Q1
MVQYAEEVQECRKVLFSRWAPSNVFIHSVSNPLSRHFGDSSSHALDSCGHCDNCTRSGGAVQDRDVTLDAWRIIKICMSLRRRKERITANQLRDACRGIGILKEKIDLSSVQGKVSLSGPVGSILFRGLFLPVILIVLLYDIRKRRESLSTLYFLNI